MTCWFPAFYRGRMMGIFFAFGIFSGVIGGPLGAALLKLNGVRVRGMAMDFPGRGLARRHAGILVLRRCVTVR